MAAPASDPARPPAKLPFTMVVNGDPFRRTNGVIKSESSGGIGRSSASSEATTLEYRDFTNAAERPARSGPHSYMPCAAP